MCAGTVTCGSVIPNISNSTAVERNTEKVCCNCTTVHCYSAPGSWAPPPRCHSSNTCVVVVHIWQYHILHNATPPLPAHQPDLKLLCYTVKAGAGVCVIACYPKVQLHLQVSIGRGMS